MRRPCQELPGSVRYCSAPHRGQNQRGASSWLSRRGGVSLGRGRYVGHPSSPSDCPGIRAPPGVPGGLAGEEKFQKKIDKRKTLCYTIPCCWAEHANYGRHAGVAQPVEQLICNQQVGGSNPSTSSIVDTSLGALASV